MQTRVLHQNIQVFCLSFSVLHFIILISGSKMQTRVLHQNIQVFCLSFSVLHFIILISGSKSAKLAQKFCIFLKFLTLEGTLPYSTIPS